MMPTYDYKCPVCGWRWELVRPMKDVNEPTYCHNCGNLAKLAFVSPPVIPWFPDTTKSPFKK
jgi:putative FmdB family regulatory protein